jgi:spore germination cell wall hydrolase CwlJ-like protein
LRIWNLLIVLTCLILGNSTHSPAAIHSGTHCLAAAAEQSTARFVNTALLLPGVKPQTTSVDDTERDYLIRTIAFEATGETEVGMAAVAHVILNRTRAERWGDTIQDVVLKPWQFEPWMTRRAEMERLSPEDSRYLNAARIADAVLAGEMPDPTAGATHFLNPVIVKKRRGGTLPKWARGEGRPFGRHTFYAPETGLLPPAKVAQDFTSADPMPSC